MIMKPADERRKSSGRTETCLPDGDPTSCPGTAVLYELMRRLDRLRTNPRAEVEIIGTSRTGRPIPLVSITDESANDRPRQTASEGYANRLAHNRLLQPRSDGRRGPFGVALDGSFRVPLLFLSSNFGMEAAQVEALLELIEFLATDGL